MNDPSLFFRACQFIIIKDIKHPTSPNIPVEAPAEKELALYVETQAEKMFPPIPDRRNISPVTITP